MISKEELIKDEQRKIDKAFGALVGLAIGDSFGDASRTEDNHLRFGITMDFTEEASWSTDDTEFALLTAQAIIDCGGKFSSEAVVAAWETYILHQTEYHRGGNSEIEAALNLRRGLKPPLSGMYNAYHISDGAAMRAAPIGIVCAGDLKKASEWAKMDASVSHYRDGVWGAQAVAAGVACAMVDGTVDEVIEAAKSVIPNDSWFYYTFTKAMAIIDQYETLEAAWTPLHTELWTTYKAAVRRLFRRRWPCFDSVVGILEKASSTAGTSGAMRIPLERL